MRKLLFSVIVSALGLTQVSLAQGFYVEPSFGYNFSMGCNTSLLTNSTSEYTFNNDNNQSTYYYTDEAVRLNLGRGAALGVNLGYMFSENIGAELQLNYLLGSPVNGESINTNTVITGGMITSKSTSTSKTQYTSNAFQVAPSIVLQTQVKNITPYAKFGPMLSFGNVLIEQDRNNAGSIESSEIKLNGGVGLGISSRLGVLFQTKGAMSYFAECSIVGMTYAPTKGELTKSITNGVDNLPNLNTSEKVVEFVDEVSGGSIQDPNKPSQILPISYPFSSIGLRVGIRVDLTKK